MELRVESKLPNDEGCEFSESMALLSKKFERALKRLNTLEKGNSQTRKFAYGTCNPTKPTQGTIRSNLRNKPIQCRECGGYGCDTPKPEGPVEHRQLAETCVSHIMRPIHE